MSTIIRTVRNVLEKLITDAEGFELIGSYCDLQEAIVLIPLMKPDVVLMDIHLGNGESGIDCIRKLRPDYPELKFMICTVFDDDEKIFDALCAGANGYMLKRTVSGGITSCTCGKCCEGGAPMSGLDCPESSERIPGERQWWIGMEPAARKKRKGPAGFIESGK